MSLVSFHPEALNEFLESARYYESQQPNLGHRFVDAVREAIHRIAAHPLLYHVVEGNVRQCQVLRFPYGIIFRVKADRIEIVAVMHLRRQPGYWKERMD
jgi:toxin ParE1/3/4